MTSPFNTERTADPPRSRTDIDDRMTLVNGRTFTVADRSGELTSPGDGTIFEDLRMLSRFVVSVGETAGETVGHLRHKRLATSIPTPFHSVVVSRPAITDGEARQLIVHRQWIGRGVRHDVEVHNIAATDHTHTVVVDIDTDFAHIFDVKAGLEGAARSALEWSGATGRLVDPESAERAIDICCDPAPADVDVDAKRFVWHVVCPARESTTVSMSFEPVWDGIAAGLAFPLGTSPARSAPALRLNDWQQHAPRIECDDDDLTTAFDQSLADLASLRIFDPLHADRTIVAAGAPWFMTLFGRDSLLTSWMTLPFVPDLALGVLRALADLQGTEVHPETEEQPGKIIHELRRHGGDDAFAERGRYYGTVDATPLFVMLAGEARRWGQLSQERLEDLWPNIRAAIEMVDRSMTDDPTGWLRYARSTPTGLINQGWKDSWDGVTFADGRVPSGPIALSEVQGYAYAALRDGAELARLVTEPGLDADLLERRAEHLRERYEEAFWMESASAYALGIAADGSQIDSVTTNPGHAIWAGLADSDHAGRYLDRIVDDDLFSGWGLRTLSPSAAAYNPLSYHNGSVWPHDTAIVIAAAQRLGRTDVVGRLVTAALDTANRFDGRPPELFSGIARSVIDTPVSYPDSCSPQAWASASTLLNVRSLLSLESPMSPDHAPRHDAPTAAVAHYGVRALRGVRVGSSRFVIELR